MDARSRRDSKSITVTGDLEDAGPLERRAAALSGSRKRPRQLRRGHVAVFLTGESARGFPELRICVRHVSRLEPPAVVTAIAAKLGRAIGRQRHFECADHAVFDLDARFIAHGGDPPLIEIEAAKAELQQGAAVVRLNVRRQHPRRRLGRAAGHRPIVEHDARHARTASSRAIAQPMIPEPTTITEFFTE